MKKIIPPALALWLVAPIFGELFSGSSPLNEYIQPLTFLTLSLLYGCGAIIVRELVVRWKKGWLAVLMLGLAYGIYEEGLLVQSFFDPTWMDLGRLAVYGRLWGVNWVWAEHLTIYHALISIAASIAFVEALYPERRDESWVTGRWWWIANWAGFLGIYLIWEAFTTYDPGLWKPLSWLAVLLLGLLARFLPARVLRLVDRSPVSPACFWWTGFLGYLLQFLLVYLPSENNGLPFPLAMLILLAFDLFVLRLVLRWNGSGAAWDDRQRLALINGALGFFLLVGLLSVAKQSPIVYLTNPLFLLWLWWIARQVGKRIPTAKAPASQLA